MKRLGFTLVLALAIADRLSAGDELDADIALQPAHVIVNPWRFHIPPTKRQGVPGLERTAKGRLWVIHGREQADGSFERRVAFHLVGLESGSQHQSFLRHRRSGIDF